MENKVREVLKNISGLRGFENLKLRKSGPFIFGEVQVKIGKTVNVKRAYEISKNIENEIRKKIKSIDSFTVSVSPYQTQRRKICIPIDKNKGLDSQVSEHFGRAKNFLFLETDNSQIKNYYTKKNPYKEKEIRAGLNSALFITKEKVDSVITKEIGPISFHTLRDNIVDIYKVADVNVKEIIKDFPDKLRIFRNPTREKI